MGSEIILNPNTGEIVQAPASSLEQREAIVMEYSTIVREKDIKSSWQKDPNRNFYYWKDPIVDTTNAGTIRTSPQYPATCYRGKRSRERQCCSADGVAAGTVQCVGSTTTVNNCIASSGLRCETDTEDFALCNHMDVVIRTQEEQEIYPGSIYGSLADCGEHI